ncbi:hypothetical protein P175DRAFT_099531 [Aspergillus ochraceoroseus IBT 24754]|uniref:Uncharacterized protein n=1 Tax=Aspergillus ochraceoroseus IBT 24754 TaxID=1392256 RepID=A0A2T5LMW3_9EURO|nr:uncharacterized protein P175DRAFT_099531 [Aspergillus ochraceoroseus IBT 24754]PTU17625.1 hypothetical protein P175DRAFT_099531 [Aspergillus ochraceoroseus IBT 24754]
MLAAIVPVYLDSISGTSRDVSNSVLPFSGHIINSSSSAYHLLVFPLLLFFFFFYYYYCCCYCYSCYYYYYYYYYCPICAITQLFPAKKLSPPTSPCRVHFPSTWTRISTLAVSLVAAGFSLSLPNFHSPQISYYLSSLSLSLSLSLPSSSSSTPPVFH